VLLEAALVLRDELIDPAAKEQVERDMARRDEH
jgi:hypothetical protein